MLVKAASYILSKVNIILSFLFSFFFFFVKGVILLLRALLAIGKVLFCVLTQNFKLGDSYYCPAYLVV